MKAGRRCGPRSEGLALALALLLLLGACGGGGDAASGTAAGQPPGLGAIDARQDGYRSASLSARASDADGSVVQVQIHWGDGQVTQLEGPLTSFVQNHRYDRAQSYTIRIRAVDDSGLVTEVSVSVGIDTPPQVCVGVADTVQLCVRSDGEFSSLSVQVRAGDLLLGSFTVREDDTDPLRLPLAGGFGHLTLLHDFVNGFLRFAGEICPPLLPCRPIGEQGLQL